METVNDLLLAEFFTSTGYLERLLFAFTELEKLHCTPRGKNQIQKLLRESHTFFTNQFESYGLELINEEWGRFKVQIKAQNIFIETFIKLPYKSLEKEKAVINYINLLYRHSFEIHNFLMETSQLEVEFPRLYLIQKETVPSIVSSEVTWAPLFSLDEKALQHYAENLGQHSSLVFLEKRREEKYEANLHQGHQAITQKNYAEAKKRFSQARNYKETAEVLTLLAWTHSLTGDPAQAKSFCMKALELDSQYGPAYNDFGNYLLAEGRVEESLRWFELAKRASNYQNREYPYINAGRAHVLLKDYEQALSEFSLALTLAPHHQELHETVTKLRMNLTPPMEQ